MKAKYTGTPKDNYYGMNLVTGETYDIPEHLQGKVKANPNFKTATRKKAAKK